jgi:DNA-binding NarL/FixJ family response regulator
MTDEPLRLLIADDHVEFRQGLEALLQTGSATTIVGTASTGNDAIRKAAQLQPDVVVMDLHMPDIDGVEATRQIVSTSPHIRVLVFTMFDDDDSVFSAMQAGARGYLLKGAGREEILRAITAVARGEAIFGPSLAHRIAGFFSVASGRPAPFPQLSERERELLQLLAEGHSNTDIAQRLYLSPKTVRNHVSNIFTKLEVASRAEAIILAREAGIGRQQSTRWTGST